MQKIDDSEASASAMNDPATNGAAAEQTASGSLQHIALIGVGPPGAPSPAGVSLALAWKKARPALVVTGFSEASGALERAEAAGAIDRKAASPDAAARGADLVVLAGRLPAALRHLDELAPHLEEGTLVTDTGTVKQPIAQQAAAVLPDAVSFVGGHPVASPERPASGEPDAADFEGGLYVLCPPGDPTRDADAFDPGALRARHPDLLALVEATGARVKVMPAARHDRLCANTRDLPTLLSMALAEVAADEGDLETLQALAGPAFRALGERPALTDERREELVGNEGAVLDALGRYVRALQQVRRRLAAGDLTSSPSVDAIRDSQDSPDSPS